MLKKILFCILLISSLNFIAQNPNIRFKKLTIKEGLSQSTINSIIQDQFGFMWFGTQEGLNRFDGYEVLHFKHQIKKKNTLSNSFILSTFEDSKGVLWAGTNAGLNYKPPLTNEFKRTENKFLNSGVKVKKIVEDKLGFLWIALEEKGIVKYRLKDDSLIHFTTENGLSSNRIKDLIIQNDSLLIIGTADAGINTIVIDNLKISTPSYNNYLINQSINDLFLCKDSLLYIATNKGVNIVTESRVINLHNELKNKVISSVFCESENSIWVGTKGSGLYSLNKIKGKYFIKNYVNSDYDLSSMSSDIINQIYKDFSGNIWVGTQYGVSYFDPLKQNFELISNSLDGQTVISDNNIWSIFEETTQSALVGTRKGVSRIDFSSNTIFNYEFKSENILKEGSNDVWDIIVDDQNRIWTATNSGVYLLNLSENYEKGVFQKLKPNDTVFNQPVYDLNIDSKNRLWIALKEGIGILDLNTLSYNLIAHDPNNPSSIPDADCRRIFFSSNGKCWLGFDGGGFCELNFFEKEEEYSYEAKTYLYKQDEEATISSNTVLTISEDEENNLWLGTMGGGLNKFNPKTKKFRFFTEEDGLSNNTIYGTVIDNKGMIWMSTNVGISRFDPQIEKFKNFNEANGLQSNEFNNNAYCKSNTGKIYFGGINGFNVFNPNEIEINRVPPKIILTDFMVLKSNKFQNYIKDDNPYYLDSVSLKSSENNLSINFTGLHFTDPASNKYKIHLEGLYDKPIEIKKLQPINYSNIPPGDYTFKIWASNNDGVWSEPEKIKIYISSPYWKTWEFIVSSSILVFLIIWGVYLLRVRTIKRQQRRLAFLVERRTKTITKQKDQIEIQNKNIEKEKEKADKLLLNILPSETADELKNKGVATTRQYRKATVMFTDIKDFSKVAETMDPSKLVKSLDNLFREFDKIIEKHQIEKIKTMGDAYMAVGGLPLRDKENPINCVLAALEIQRYMDTLKKESIKRGEGFWELRIGIHTGDVIAGVIGSKRIAYDIWGSTVNIAQRMETSGETWKVNVSQSTYEHIAPFFKCTNRGQIPTKNTGEISMFFIEGIKPHLSEKGKGLIPNKKFRDYIDLHLYSSINYKKAERHIMKILREKLPPNLHYHSIKHTYDVVQAVERIAIMEGVLDEDIFVLKSAATYHDAGFVEAYDKNEPIGAKMAENILPKYGYTPEQIEQVKELIYATIIPHNPKNKLEKIICDADLDYLGRDDFYEISDSLRRELRDHGKINSDRLWDEIQVKFLTQHQYFTKSAIKMRAEKKEEHLQVIKARLKKNEYKD
ncbi:MAG: hypothetical protein CL846_00550 [Crocinitomicaceae bacterium]|nr:hypothetical protein [Crocinitomicaceae bacterium]